MDGTRLGRVAAVAAMAFCEVASLGWAAPADQAGTGGLQVLRLGASARAMAMGGAYTSAPAGPDGVWLNPANLSGQSHPAVLLGHAQWLEDIRLESAAAALPLKAGGGLGIGVSYLHMGEFQRLDAKGNPDGVFRVWDGVMALGYGRRLGERWATGVAGKLVVEQLEDSRGMAGGVDIGVQHDLGWCVEGVRAGAVIQNVGVGPTFLNERARMPSVVRAGVSWSGFDQHVVVTVEGEKAVDSRARLLSGLEVGVPGWVWARGGYRTGQDAGNGLTMGLGVRLAGWDLDYAMVDYGVLGGTHWVNLSTRFGRT